MYFFIFIVFIFAAAGVFLLLKNIDTKEVAKEVLPYQAKKFFFTKSEQQFFRILNESIDPQRFTIFTKVRLADFVEVKIRKEESQKWWNKIRSKHVDFLVWDIVNSSIALAVEVDGRSHESERMIISDAFKNELYETVGIPLYRVRVGSDFKVEAEKLVLSLSTD